MLGLLGLAACVAGEVPAPNVPRALIATPGSATVTPEPPPSGCHLTAFGEPPTERETADALAKLANLDARAKTTFDVAAGKPTLSGSPAQVRSVWPSLVAKARELDEALQTIRSTPAIAALALLRVGAIYDAMDEALVAWRRSQPASAVLAKLTQLRNSGRDELIDLAADMEAKIMLKDLGIVEQANALTAYLGVLQLLAISPRGEVAALRTRTEARVHELFSVVPDAHRATRTLQDPTSDSPICLLDLVDPTR